MNEKKEKRKMYREFTVTPGLVGFKVKIGCSEAYFGDADSVGKAITTYLDNPQGTAEVYRTADQRLNIALGIAHGAPAAPPIDIREYRDSRRSRRR